MHGHTICFFHSKDEIIRFHLVMAGEGSDALAQAELQQTDPTLLTHV